MIAITSSVFTRIPDKTGKFQGKPPILKGSLFTYILWDIPLYFNQNPEKAKNDESAQKAWALSSNFLTSLWKATLDLFS